MSQYEVLKFARGSSGQWFAGPARRYATFAAAEAAFRAFAADQTSVLGNGIRIDLRTRKGRVVLMTVGGRMHEPAVIRDLRENV